LTRPQQKLVEVLFLAAAYGKREKDDRAVATSPRGREVHEPRGRARIKKDIIIKTWNLHIIFLQL
jgi:hypothetical protein